MSFWSFLHTITLYKYYRCGLVWFINLYTIVNSITGCWIVMCFRHDPIPVTLSNPLFSILIGFSQLSIVCLEFPFNPWHQHLCHWIKTPHSSFAPHKTHLFNIFFLLQSLVLSMKGPNFLNTCRFIPIFRKFEQVVTDIRKVSHWNIFLRPLLQIFQSTRSLHMSRCRSQKSLFLPMTQHNDD